MLKNWIYVGIVCLIFFNFSCFLFKNRNVSYQKVLLKIKTDETANAGRSFYLAVIKVKDERKFAVESYQEVLDRVLNSEGDESLLALRIMLPGKKEKIYIYTQKFQPIAIYAFFTEPSPYWKLLLKEPLKKKYKIIVEGNRLRLK